MSNFTVRMMSIEDIDFAVRLTDTMKWDLIEEDFKFMIELEPEGCFVLLSDSKKVGLVTNINYGKVGWMGNVIISEDYRGRGGGALLIRHSINYLTNKHVKTIGLYSVIEKIPLYKKHDFVYDSEFIVLEGKGFSQMNKVYIKEAMREDVEGILELDRLCFGASRSKVLAPILGRSENLCYTYTEKGKIVGYVIGKIYEGFVEVGPLVCRNGRTDVAIDLLKKLLKNLVDFRVSICIKEKASEVINILLRFGFSEAFRVVRMFYGEPDFEDCIYVAESLERG